MVHIISDISDETIMIQMALEHQLMDDVKPTADVVMVMRKKIWHHFRYVVEHRFTRRCASHLWPCTRGHLRQLDRALHPVHALRCCQVKLMPLVPSKRAHTARQKDAPAQDRARST